MLGRYISNCLLASIFAILIIVPRCHGLVSNHIVKRCWSDVNKIVSITKQYGNTTCFTTDNGEAICYEIMSDTFMACEPPWKLVSVTDPATIDHLAVAMNEEVNLNINFFPAVMSSNIPASSFYSYFEKNSECSTISHIHELDIHEDTCALLTLGGDIYEAQFVNDSCFGSGYACSKAVSIAPTSISLPNTDAVDAAAVSNDATHSYSYSSPSSSTTEKPMRVNLETMHIIMIAGSINILIFVLIVTILCCCCKRKLPSKKKSLISGSGKHSNRPLPTPGRTESFEKYDQVDSEYTYPTVTDFRTNNKESEKTTRAAERSASTLPPNVLPRQYGMDEDIEYMHIGETVLEHQEALIQRRRQTQNRSVVHSYLELEALPKTGYNDVNTQRPITHTYADLDNITHCDKDCRQGAKFKQHDLDKPQICYMGLSNVPASHTYMDVSVYKGLRNSNLVPSGCSREGCQECESAHQKQNSRNETGNHDSTSSAYNVTTETAQSPFYQQNIMTEPTFYMAVEGKPEGSCEIGDMAKCFEDNTYSFLK